MGQFIVALLIGGFFSVLVLALQHCFETIEDTLVEVIPEEPSFTYEVNIPYSASVFRDPKNHPWMFTDNIMVNIINYFRSELRYYKDGFKPHESIELSLILYDKTHLIEELMQESKRGKIKRELFAQILDVKFEDKHDEKVFLLESVFKEAHNTIIDDILQGRNKC